MDLKLAFRAPKRPYRLGLIGLGGISRAHQDAYRQMGWPVVHGADIDPARRAWAQSEFAVPKVSEDWRAVVEDPEVEVVSLLTQPNIRLEVVQACAALGKPIQTEKPLAATVEEGERMVEVAEHAGIPLGVSQNYRWFGTSFLARALVDRGEIGTPFFTSITIYGTQDRHIESGFYTQCEDFLTVQWNTHLADLSVAFAGRPLERLLTFTNRSATQRFVSDNLLLSILDFGRGCTGQITHHELLAAEGQVTTMRVDGDRGSVEWELWGDRLTLSTAAGTQTFSASTFGLPNSMAGPMGDFLAGVEDGVEPTVSGRKNLAVLRHVFADQASSLAGGEWIQIGS